MSERDFYRRLIEQGRRYGVTYTQVAVEGLARLLDALEEAEREYERLRRERDTLAARCNSLVEQLNEIAAERQARSWRGEA